MIATHYLERLRFGVSQVTRKSTSPIRLMKNQLAADLLPFEQKEALLRFLANRFRQQETAPSSPASFRSKRGFPISKGRRPFTSADVARIEAEA
jgi:hypothetical protein